MVEFGLKLEANKFSEWYNDYIDYEKLKYLLKKLSSALKERDSLEKKNSVLALVIRREFVSSDKFRSNSSSKNSSPAVSDCEGDNDKHKSFDGNFFLRRTREKEPLLLDKQEKMGSESSVGYLAMFNTDSRFKSKYEYSLNDVEYRFKQFSNYLYEQVGKVNKFYNEQEEELRGRLDFLVESAHQIPTISYSLRKRRATLFARSVAMSMRYLGKEIEEEEVTEADEKEEKLMDSVKRDLTHLYRTGKLLSNFAHLNCSGFVKIIKKFNKTFPEKKGSFSQIINDKMVNEGVEVDLLCERIEKMYMKWFRIGNLREAQIDLLPKKGDGLEMDWGQLHLGFRMGMCSVLMLWVCWDCIWGLVQHGKSTIGGRSAFPVFRGCGGLLLLHWFWGISVWVWKRYRINYIYLFDFNPGLVASPFGIMQDVVDETLVFLVLMLLYYKAGAGDIPLVVPPGVYPLLLVFYAVKTLVFPLQKRIPLWRSIWKVVTTPLSSPSFFQTYIADVFTSMVKVFQDLVWIICFVANGDFSENASFQWKSSFWYKNVTIPLVCLLPLWFRLNQCLRKYIDTKKRCPNLANAFKYALSQTVTLFGAFHPLYQIRHSSQRGQKVFQFFWLGLFITSSLYSFFWDVYIDWGLGDWQHGFLTERRMFPNRFYYYLVIALDLFLRFMWVNTLVPPSSGASFEVPEYLSFLTMFLELLRRTLWAFFRLENEHRQNTNKYRRTDFVPLHFDTGHELELKESKKHLGWNVLAEVIVVMLLVMAVSVSSILAAENLNHQLNDTLEF